MKRTMLGVGQCTAISGHFFDNYITLDSGINVGVRLLIFKKNLRKKNKKWPQWLDWCKKVIKSWCEKF